jgi:hypothetical protein
VWNIPPRSPAFTGRDSMLLALRDQLREGGPVVVLTLHGMGGVGKTSLAVEYAHRFAGNYDVSWWISAEQAGLIGDQLAALGLAAGWVAAASDTPTSAREVLRRLRRADGWLVVFDNVEAPDDVIAWLPQGPGHVLVTSRNPNWRQLATPVDVDVFDRDESVALLHQLAPGVSTGDADCIADAVGDLPLAVAQAGGVLAETAITAADCLQELAQHARQVMGEGKPPSYPTTLAAAVQISLDRLAAEDQAAVQLLQMCTLLAPEPVPVGLFTAATDGLLPEPLASVATSVLALRRTLGRISRYGLAKIGPTGPHLHRLTQAIILDLDEGARVTARSQVERLLVAAAPGDSRDPKSWPQWAQFLPHLLAIDPGTTRNPALRSVASEGTWYLLEHGDLQTGHELAEHLYRQWHNRLGPDDPHTLHAARHVASAVRRLGHYAQAHALDEDTLTRRRRVLGEDHPHTLSSANDVALGLYLLNHPQQARSLHDETLRRLRETHGQDRRLTLGVAHNLAVDLRALGRREEALDLNLDTFRRRRRVLGEDHPHTLLSAADLARDLFDAGRVTEALDLHRDTLARRQRVLGHDHPHTLKSASSTAIVLYQLGRVEEAVALQEDTLDRRARVLGENHPNTLLSSVELTGALRDLGRSHQAEVLETRFRHSQHHDGQEPGA